MSDISGPIFEELPLEIEVSLQEWETIKRGSIPQSMEQKWTIFVRDEYLNFHRMGYTLYKTRPELINDKMKFHILHCRRGIEHIYSPDPNFDESSLVTELIEIRLASSFDEPWFGWDPRYPQTKNVLEPDFSKFESK